MKNIINKIGFLKLDNHSR